MVIQSTTAFTSGASGGALFDHEGRLVGILTFRLPGPQGYYFSAPVDWIAARVDAVEGFTGIAPLAATRSFWQRPPQDLPYFMRAALLEAGDQWDELLKLADAWAIAEDDSPEPWLARGKACLRLDRREAAVEAFIRATMVEPASGEAWFNLGVTYFRLGEATEVQRAHATLSQLNPGLAEDLAVISGLSLQ
jgi:tetratricopeptide (TPR) repeat protein